MSRPVPQTGFPRFGHSKTHGPSVLGRLRLCRLPLVDLCPMQWSEYLLEVLVAPLRSGRHDLAKAFRELLTHATLQSTRSMRLFVNGQRGCARRTTG
jgi:hypothetical protein